MGGKKRSNYTQCRTICMGALVQKYANAKNITILYPGAVDPAQNCIAADDGLRLNHPSPTFIPIKRGFSKTLQAFREKREIDRRPFHKNERVQINKCLRINFVLSPRGYSNSV